MIHLLASPPASLPGDIFVLDGPPLVPWGAARRLLGALEAARGADAVAAALAPHRPSLGLVLRGLALSDEESAVRDAVSLTTLGHLPNMFPDSRRLAAAWAAVLAPLLRGATLYVPDLFALDADSSGLPRRLAAILGSSLRVVIVAAPTDLPAPDAPTAASLTAERLHWELRLLRTLAAPDAPPDGAGQVFAGRPHPADDRLEERAWSDGTPDLLLAAARAAWSAYGLPVAFELAERLLARDPDHPAAGELHTIVGMSLYTASYAQGEGIDAERTSRMVASFEQALEREADPARRAHLMYRLTVARSRFRGAHDEALAFADTAVDAARHPGIVPGVSAFCEAWARNGRALARFRTGDLGGAAAECEAALARLDACAPHVPDAEVDLARFVIMDNLARVSFVSGHRSDARAWQERCEQVDARIPVDRRPFTIWSLQHTIDNNLVGALRHFGLRLEEALAKNEPIPVALMRHLLADCAYRLGRPEDAAAGFGEALRLWTLLGDDEGSLLQTRLNLAVSLVRARRLVEARDCFDALLEHPYFEAGDPRADLLTGAAYARALAGDHTAAAALFAEAHAEAESDDVRARVWRTQGEALGGAAAVDAWRRGLALAEASPPEDRFGLLAALLATEPERLEEVLELAPEALADPNAWWDLPRVAAAVRAAGELGEPAPEGEPARIGLARVREAASQRDDARADVGAWAEAWVVG